MSPNAVKKSFLYLIVVIASLISLMQYATLGNVAYTMDSLTYRDGAENFLAGHPMQVTNTAARAPERLPSLQWPPGYSGLWAGASRILGSDLDRTPAILNQILLMVSAAGLFWICLISSGSGGVAGIATLACMSTPAIMAVFGHAWSEPLYLSLEVLAYALLLKFRDTQRSTHLLLAVLFVGLANWTRYTGVILLPLLGMTVFLVCRASMKKRMLVALLSMLLASAVVAPLWAHNFIHTGGISGSARGGAAAQGLYRIVEDVDTLMQLLGYSLLSFDMTIRAHLEVPVAAALLYLMISRIREAGIRSVIPIDARLPLLWFSANLAFLLYARVVQKMVDMDFRMISVAMPFLFIFFSSYFKDAQTLRGIRPGRALALVVASIICYTGLSEALRIHANYQANSAPNWRSNFGLAYRDLTRASRATQSLAKELEFIPPKSLLITDYRPLYIRYLTGADAYSAYSEGECVTWVTQSDGGYVLIGKKESMQWAERCTRLNRTWTLYQVTGRGAPSMYSE